jgi:hypothetical protein
MLVHRSARQAVLVRTVSAVMSKLAARKALFFCPSFCLFFRAIVA